MKRKWIIIILALTILGCSGAGVMLTGLTAAQVGLEAFDIKDAMKNVDYKMTVKDEFNKVWEAALTTTEEMGIEVLDKKVNENKDRGIITGKTKIHQKIQIIVAAATQNITNVGIKARKRELLNMPITAQDVDTTFAHMIVNEIGEKCNMF